MLKIAVFGFYGLDHARIVPPDDSDHVSPVDTESFMRIVWELEPPATRIGKGASEVPCFVKLTQIASQPVYVQSLSNRMAPGAALLNCDGYIAIIDAVKILAPRTIQQTLRRLFELHPYAPLIIAAGRQNEREALSSDELRELFGLHPDLPIYPYVPGQPKTVARMIRRLARYIDDPNRVAPPIFAGDPPAPPRTPVPAAPQARAASTPARAQIHELAHVAITVSDLSRSLDFYQGLLGFRLLGQIELPDQTITQLDTGRGVIELFSTRTPPAPQLPEENSPRVGLRHLALGVTGLDLIVEQLACAGVEVVAEPHTTSGVRHARLLDPDDIPIELIERNVP